MLEDPHRVLHSDLSDGVRDCERRQALNIVRQISSIDPDYFIATW